MTLKLRGVTDFDYVPRLSDFQNDSSLFIFVNLIDAKNLTSKTTTTDIKLFLPIGGLKRFIPWNQG